MDNILLNDIVDILNNILDILNNISDDILDILNNILDILFQTYEAEERWVRGLWSWGQLNVCFFSFEACEDLRQRERNREREES